MILTEQVINEVLQRLDEKVDTKIDLTDDKHLAKLEYIMLFEMNFPLSDTHEMLDRLTEKRKPGDVWKTQTGWAGLKPGEERAQYGMSDKETAQKYVSGEEDESDDKTDTSSTTAEPISTEDLRKEQEETSRLRDKGVAGAGGESASQGESRYCKAVDTLDYDNFGKENRKDIDKKKEELKSKKKLSAEESGTLNDLGFEEPYSDEAYDYLATREVWAEQELARMTNPENQPNVFTSGSGFAKDKKAYMAWMRAAFDGALATQEHLKESRMDTSKPFQTIQSDNKPPRNIDDRVQSDLEQKVNDPNLSEEDREYYKKQLKDFKKFREYHDTYIVGQDEKGRTFIVSVSNKKSSKLDDPQNNTTPAARFAVMKEDFGEKVAKRVTLSINDGVRKVTTVTEQTRKSSSEVDIDDDFATLAEAASPKRIKEVDRRATMVDKKTGKAPRYGNGRPKKGAEFSCWLEDNSEKIGKDYDKMSRAEKLKVMQQFMGDDDWHKENETEVAYEPYSKVFIKAGEAVKGGRGFGPPWEKKNPKAAKVRNSDNKGAKQVEEIKRNEQEAVKEAHQNVVNEVTEADKEQGFPKDGKNGPHTQAYIGTVMDAMHFDSYIDMDDEDDDKMLIQMGIVGAKPSHIRGCLGEQSGYNIPPGDREGLKKHLRETCSIEAETGAIIIKSKDEDGETTRIADDTWRTAGTSQKVASGFGTDMRDCVKAKVRSQRDNPKGK